MKARFIKPALFVLLGIFIGMYFLRCGNDVGIGSDFDSTKYYTKSEVDQMMADYYTQSEVENMIAENNTAIISTSVDLFHGDVAYSVYGKDSSTESHALFLAPTDGILNNFCHCCPSV